MAKLTATMPNAAGERPFAENMFAIKPSKTYPPLPTMTLITEETALLFFIANGLFSLAVISGGYHVFF